MATEAVPNGGFSSHESTQSSPWSVVKRALEPLASLRLTVVLFALSIFLILAGTFAQVDKDIWEVIRLYFRCWVAWIPFQIFFPSTFFTETPWIVPGGIYFPGGKVLGLLLALNLLSAHLVRFKIEATGSRLFAGLVTITAGVAVTWGIVAAGANSKGIQGDPWLPYSTQWIGYQGLLAMMVVAAGCGLVVLCQKPLAHAEEKWGRQLFLRAIIGLAGITCAALLTWLMVRGEVVRPSDASLRILWQLAQGTAASLALLAGCWLVFGKRAGVVLLHAGVGLMMFYELHVALTAVETQLTMVEGETTNFVQDIRTSELAVSEFSDKVDEKVVAIPKTTLLSGKLIDDVDLPFTIEVTKFLENATLHGVTSKDKNPATLGNGLVWFAEAARTSAGADSDSRVDTPAAYLTLKSKSDGKVLGTYLTSMLLTDDESDTISVNDKRYRLELRAKRYYKPYRFDLLDVKKEDYLGTSTPRNYASRVHIFDPTRNVDEIKTIWMNNPLRFADETFYQSSYFQDKNGNEHTTLSVVTNSGWMMPYIGCMLVGIGMAFHFLNFLFRFMLKGDTVELTEDESARAAQLARQMGMTLPKSQTSQSSLPAVSSSSKLMANVFTAVIAASALLYIGSTAMLPKAPVLSFDLYRFGQIPVVSEGRSKPLDSAATSALLAISGKSDVTVGEHDSKQKIPAIRWLLEVIAEAKAADDYQIFRIENLELQETVGVKKREGMRYSRNELKAGDKEFEKQVRLAREVQERDSKQLSIYQRKVLELNQKVSTYENLKFAFGLHHRINGKTEQQVLQAYQMAMQFAQGLEEQGQPVFAVAPQSKDDNWHIYSRAYLLDLINRVQKNGNENKSVTAWEQLFRAFDDDKPQAFNKATDDLIKLVDDNPPEKTTPWIIRLESYLNQSQPFKHANRLYLVAFILGSIGWLTWPYGFNRAAFTLLLITLAVHSAALLARVVISGRPPVTNLYSSAVFIGWGCVMFGLALEIVYNIGIGNLVAAVAGYATLLVAEGLALDGDTFTVLQAVLDTQFWLATHVTCITMGYATTYLAGLFGIAYIARGVFTPSLTVDEGRDIYRMIYGTLCFSIFYSFVGTVLGGLWADDSWGRFWGWDPKENAALIIVLWNALALHARWGGMVRERGLACLAVGGNIFVSWSWWGVNALGAGLHSYGFKQGTLLKLLAFIAVNLLIIGIGMLPKKLWWSHHARETKGLA